MSGNARLEASATAILLLVSSAGQASTYRVPADYPTIQDALNVSGAGDTVLVAPGTYSDYVVYGDGAYVARPPDGVALMSEAGPSQTVIDLAPLEGVVYWSIAFGMSLHTSGQTVIEGFHVVGLPPNSRGVSIGSSAHTEIRDCVFESPVPADPATSRKGVNCRESDLLVKGCTFLRCSGDDGAGITSLYGPLVVESCTFIECADQGIRAVDGPGPGPHSVEIRASVFQRVTSKSSGGCVAIGVMPGGVLIDGCVFKEPGLTAFGTTGAALYLGGGPKTISSNVFHDMDLTDGIACISLSHGSAVVTGNTFAHCHQPTQTSSLAASVLYTSQLEGLAFFNNVVAHTSGSKALSFLSGTGPVTLGCNVFWDNDEGIGTPIAATDRIVDPQFCDPKDEDYAVQATSPCLPPYSLGCGLIGALGQGCGSVSVEPESWAKVKAAYRDPSADGREEEKE